jgi:hypothetical protein
MAFCASFLLLSATPVARLRLRLWLPRVARRLAP